MSEDIDVGQILEILNNKADRDLKNTDLSSLILPTGSVIAFAANSTPNGYLICNGAAVSRTTYAYLFGVIGTTYGAGDGSTTFNVPNLTDRFIQGSGTAGTKKDAGLPNISGTIGVLYNNIGGGIEGLSGAFTASGSKDNYAADGSGGQLSSRYTKANFNASNSNSIYGKSSTVQPPALTMRFYIKY